MLLRQFDGGVSNRLAPHLVEPTAGVKYANIDISKGVLTPVKDMLNTQIPALLYSTYFDAEDRFVSFAIPTSFVEFQQRMYSADGFYPKVNKGGIIKNLGIVSPRVQGAFASLQHINRAPPLTKFTVQNATNTSGDLPASSLEYLWATLPLSLAVPLSTPFVFTVQASNTEETRAIGQVQSPAEPTDSYNPITTIPNSVSRGVLFSDFEPDEGTEIIQLFRKYLNVWRFVGIADATSPGTISDTVYDISGKGELDFDKLSAFNGTYSYLYTYYNAIDGVESAPSVLYPTPEQEIKMQSGSVLFTVFTPPADTQVTHIRLYRVGGLTTQFTMVVQVAVSVTTVYPLEILDEVKDIDLPGPQLQSDNYEAAPLELKYIIEAYAMLFGAVGNSLRFTPIGVPTAWPLEYDIQFEAEITGLGQVSNGILVFTKYKTFIVTGTGPFSLSQQLLQGDQGCISHYSIQEANLGTLIWASLEGLCTSSGNNVQNITKPYIGDTLLDPVNATVHNEMYYCHNTDGSTLVWDYRFKPVPVWFYFGITSIVSGRGEVYGTLGNVLHTLYKATVNLPLVYKSPLFTEGSFTEHKTYKKVYIQSEGDIIFEVLIDSVLVFTQTITEPNTQIQVPSQHQRGYSIQFEARGTGTINEINYFIGKQQNG